MSEKAPFMVFSGTNSRYLAEKTDYMETKQHATKKPMGQ